jgi:hypothetical protein
VKPATSVYEGVSGGSFYNDSFLFHFFWGGVEPSPLLLRPILGPLYQPLMIIDDDECGAIGEMLGTENRSTRTKPALVSLCSSQIPYNLARESNPGRRVEKPTINLLRYGTANKYTSAASGHKTTIVSLRPIKSGSGSGLH